MARFSPLAVQGYIPKYSSLRRLLTRGENLVVYGELIDSKETENWCRVGWRWDVSLVVIVGSSASYISLESV